MFLGFWRPLFLLPSSGQAKKTEEKYSVQQTGNKGEYIEFKNA